MNRTSIRKRSVVRSLQSAVSLPKSSVSRSRAAASGFTLIELMMVVLVILLLSGLLFRLGTIIKNRSERAKATADLANIEHALNEYFAEYGIYPPVDFTAYEYEDVTLQPPTMQEDGFTNSVGYRYGLVSHLYKRDKEEGGLANPNTSRPDWDDDTPRDVAAKERWAHYLTDVSMPDSYTSNNIPGAVVQVYSNKVSTIKDPWGGEYQYESRPPYLSYKLWSSNLD